MEKHRFTVDPQRGQRRLQALHQGAQEDIRQASPEEDGFGIDQVFDGEDERRQPFRTSVEQHEQHVVLLVEQQGQEDNVAALDNLAFSDKELASIERILA